ncbi:MAG: T9SS type A sorting domain-containing protein, partial [Bacteroidota bacterium]
NAGTTKRLVFSWRNNNNTGTQPPAAIDNIIISYSTSGYTYSWSTTPVQTTATASNLSAGTYTVTVTDANLCTATTSVTITQPEAFSAKILSKKNVSCFGGNDGSATVDVVGGAVPYTYNWTGEQCNKTATALIAGDYMVTVTDNNGSSVTALAKITQPAALTVSTIVANTSPCINNGSITANPANGTTPYTYIWSTCAITQTISNLATGTYQLTATDACNATVIKILTVGTNSINVNAIPMCSTSACDGSVTANVTGGTEPYTYLWDDPLNQTGQTAINLCVAKYSVTVTDAIECTDVLTDIGVIDCFESVEEDIIITQNLNYINIFPNPASSILTINFTSKENSSVYLEMYNILGECVSNEVFMDIIESSITKDIRDYSNGVYLLKLTLDKKKFTQKVVIQK